jgi:TonB family protein
MKHNDKAWQDDNSARLDALLSDFLDKDIVAPLEPQSFSHPTSTPLGDLFPDAVRVTEPTSIAVPTPTPAPPQKVAPVDRTEVWEANTRTGHVSQSQPSGVENLAADRLEKNVNSMLENSAAAARGKKFLFGSIAAMLLLTAGGLIWQSRRAAVPPQVIEEPAATVLPGEGDEPLLTQTPPATAGVPESHPASSQGDGVNPSSNSRHEEHPAVAVLVPDSAATTATPSTMKSVSQSMVSNAAKLAKMPAPILGRSNPTLGTIQDLPSLQSAPPLAPLPLPPAPTASTVKNVVPDVAQAIAATPAVPLTKVQPFYPELARKMNVTGTVHVAIVVDTTGKVISAKAIDGSPVLQGSAERAVKQWRFKPSTMNGKPVTGSGTVSIIFSPDRR